MPTFKNKPLDDSLINRISTVKDLETRLKKIEKSITVIQKDLQENNINQKSIIEDLDPQKETLKNYRICKV